MIGPLALVSWRLFNPFALASFLILLEFCWNFVEILLNFV